MRLRGFPAVGGFELSYAGKRQNLMSFASTMLLIAFWAIACLLAFMVIAIP
jgi:hypothetical protein